MPAPETEQAETQPTEAAEPEISEPVEQSAPQYDMQDEPDAEEEEQGRPAKRSIWRLFGKRKHDEGM